jgi:hypothetical protein
MEQGAGYLIMALQLDHVRPEPGGPRRSLERWMQAVCPHCHLEGFIGRKDIRAAARLRLDRIYGEEPDAETDY